MKSNYQPKPGISRSKRLSEEGLQRLKRQLQSGRISQLVLEQWIKRYGKVAEELINKYKKQQ